jgi:hypothetical protein
VKAERFQHAGALGVMLKLGIRTMCRAVDFDNQFGVKGDEIDDISIDRMLATKFIVSVLSAPAIAALQHCFARYAAVWLWL